MTIIHFKYTFSQFKIIYIILAMKSLLPCKGYNYVSGLCI